MNNSTPIKEYEEAVYVYWFGPNTPSVKIGHSSDPDKRLKQLGNDTGVPDHLASFAAIVWLDRKREKVEARAHELAAEFRRSGEWFEVTATEALGYIISAAEEMGIRYEVEDRAEVYISSEELAAEAKWHADEAYRREVAAQRRASLEKQERYWRANPEEWARHKQAEAEREAKFQASSVEHWKRKFEELPFGQSGYSGSLVNHIKGSEKN